jgi:hypothetical protein
MRLQAPQADADETADESNDNMKSVVETVFVGAEDLAARAPLRGGLGTALAEQQLPLRPEPALVQRKTSRRPRAS